MKGTGASAVIFDYNGTMVYDEHLHTQAWKEYLSKQAGHAVTEEEFDTWVHGVLPLMTLRHYVDENLTAEEAAILTEEKEEIYRALCRASDYRLAPGLADYLDALKKAGIPVVIATSAGAGNIDFFFSLLPLADWFDRSHVVYDDGTIRGKPAPDIFLRAAEAAGKDIGDCIVFEDSVAGIRGAKAAGAGYVIGVSSSLPREVLLESGADEVIADYLDDRFRL